MQTSELISAVRNGKKLNHSNAYDLTERDLSEAEVQDLAAALKFQSLLRFVHNGEEMITGQREKRNVHLSRSRISSGGIKSLAQSLEETYTQTQLNLDGIALDDDGVVALCQTMRTNPRVTINFDTVRVSEHGLKALTELTAARPELKIKVPDKSELVLIPKESKPARPEFAADGYLTRALYHQAGSTAVARPEEIKHDLGTWLMAMAKSGQVGTKEHASTLKGKGAEVLTQRYYTKLADPDVPLAQAKTKGDVLKPIMRRAIDAFEKGQSFSVSAQEAVAFRDKPAFVKREAEDRGRKPERGGADPEGMARGSGQAETLQRASRTRTR